LSLDMLIGPVLVVQIPEDVGVITAAVLQKVEIPSGTLRLLFRTRNSNLWKHSVKEFSNDFVGVSQDGAEWLVSSGVQLVGIDYLSIAPYKQSIPTHRALLEPGVVILEGLDLSTVSPGVYTLYCLPLKLMGSDGAPARAILIG
jgi:arylformamidase